MKYLGIDYGLKKIGFALSEGKIAKPFKVVKITSLHDGLDKTLLIVKNEEIDKIIIGVPEGKTETIVRRFINELKKKTTYALEIIEADETLTSVTAKDLMVKLNIGKKKRKNEDAYSAALILQDFLDTLK